MSPRAFCFAPITLGSSRVSSLLTDVSARLPSLYSDFRRQRTTNPDGYAINISAWRMALAHAAREGLIPAQGSRRDLLVLSFSRELQQALETKQWGQPVALGTVIVSGEDVAMSGDLDTI
jgi:hypothetical protein